MGDSQSGTIAGDLASLSGESRVFVHITEFPPGGRRPILNDLLTSEMSSDEHGRSRAAQVLYLTEVSNPSRGASRRRSRWHALPQRIPILAVAVAAALALIISAMSSLDSYGPAKVSRLTGPGDSALATAFENGQSGIQVVGRGTVVKVLSDDTNGDRHQRFIIELASGQTILITHNIDIAPRITSLAQGAVVDFSGVYEWNAEGGVVHWTHHDPSGQHTPGWLELNGLRYQ